MHTVQFITYTNAFRLFDFLRVSLIRLTILALYKLILDLD